MHLSDTPERINGQECPPEILQRLAARAAARHAQINQELRRRWAAKGRNPDDLVSAGCDFVVPIPEAALPPRHRQTQPQPQAGSQPAWERDADHDWDKEEEKRSHLKQLLAPVQVTDLPAKPPPELVKGLLYQGCKISFSGTPKSYKTWNLLHFFFCLANGLKYLGFGCIRTAVVIFDFELIRFSIRDRLETIAREYQLPGDPFANIRIVSLRGRTVDFSEALVQELIVQDFRTFCVGAFAIDPLYKATEGLDDANSVSQVTRALRPFETLTVDGGVTFGYNQHFAKGDQTRKVAIERIAGSGGFSWDPDALVTFTKLNTEKAFAVEISQRYFPEIEPFGIRWRYPLFVRDDQLDPADLAPPPKTGRPRSDAADKIRAALCGAEQSGGLKLPQIIKATNLSRSTVRDTLKRLHDQGTVIPSVATGTWQLSAKAAATWNTED